MTLLHVIKPDGTAQSEDYKGELTYGTPSWEYLKGLVGITSNDLLEHVTVLWKGKREGLVGITSNDLLEHVTVLWKGKRAHMFVDEEGIMHKLLRNDKATRIYYNATFQRFGRAQYNNLSEAFNPVDRLYEEEGFQIVGTAVLWEGDME